MSPESTDATTDPRIGISPADAENYFQLDDGQVYEQAIWRLAIDLSAAVTPYEVSVALADCSGPAAGASFANLALLDNENDNIRVIHGSIVDPAIVAGWADRWLEFHITEDIPLCDAMRTGETVLLHSPDEAAERYPHMLQELLAASLGAIAAVPVRTAEGRMLGALGLGWRTAQEFGPVQVRRLELIAELGAQALGRAVFERDRGRQSAREAAEANVLQEAFLPAALPQTPRLELAATYLPASDAPMGGDWYDAFPVDGGLFLVVGDVGGHGLQSAAVMAQLRNAVRAFAGEDQNPETVTGRLNRMLCRLEPDETATAILAIWDEEAGTITRTNAGHPAPLRCRIGETAFLFPQASDVLLGADPGWQYNSESKFLRPGTTLLLYTDGLVELRGRSLEEGMDALRRFVESLEDLSPEVLCRQILDWRLRVAGREDDICVLAVRVH